MTRSVLARVRPEWVDHYGHMNLAPYVAVFDMATDALWPTLGLGEGFRARGLGTFAAENWVAYQREVRLNDPLAAESEVLEHDAKRLLVRHRLFHAEDGFESARCELLFLCVDLEVRKVCPWPSDVLAAFTAAPIGPPAERLVLRRNKGS
ncbi:thioesterase family protein [Roseomonas sp. WA12]